MVHTVLSDPSSDDQAAKEAVTAMSPLLRLRSGLSKPDRAAILALQKLVGGVRAQTIGAIREAFDPISRHVIFLALRHQGGSVQVTEAFCPQVGPWLQRDTSKIVGPYGENCGRWR